MSQDVSSDVRLSMTRNARAWRAGMVTTGAPPSTRASGPGASTALLRWQLNRVQTLLETQETLQLEIAEAQTALDQLQAQTWDVWLHEEDGMRYVVLPMGTLEVEGWPWTVQGQPAVLLSSE